MRRLLLLPALFMIAVPLAAQKIVTGQAGDDQIVRVQTALNHLTVIQLAQPVESVAAGSQAFKVEWRGDKVFVEPTEPNVATNLFIWTKTGRLNYELEPAGQVGEMDFAIDQPAIDPPAAPHPAARLAPPADATKLSGEQMLGGMPVRQQRWKAAKHRVQVMVRDLFTEQGTLYIRYSIQNDSRKPYFPGTPLVFQLKTSRPVMPAPAHTQLSAAAAKGLKTKSENPLRINAQQLRAATVLPGQQTVGVVGVKVNSSGPAVLRLEFGPADGHLVSATMVL